MSEPFSVRISHSEAKQWQSLAMRNVTHPKQASVDALANNINRRVVIVDPGGNLVYTAQPEKSGDENAAGDPRTQP